MWDRVVMVPGLGLWCGDKSEREDMEAVERALGVALPRSLSGFLGEMNGCSVNLAGLEPPSHERQTINLVWSCDEILQRNQALRQLDAESLGGVMSYAGLLWFVEEPGGALVGFRVQNGKVPEPTVYTHTPGQLTEPRPCADSLRQYLTENVKDSPKQVQH